MYFYNNNNVNNLQFFAINFIKTLQNVIKYKLSQHYLLINHELCVIIFIYFVHTKTLKKIILNLLPLFIFQIKVISTKLP